MSTTIATLALVVAGWSYFAQHTTMTIQSERNELALADMRGLLAFEASHDENWNVRLQKADGRPFQIDDLTLIPKYQVAREQGPIDGVPVPATPRRSTHDGNQVLEIPDALNRMCLLNETICAEHLRVIMITLDFTFDGSRYRIVANRPSS